MAIKKRYLLSILVLSTLLISTILTISFTSASKINPSIKEIDMIKCRVDYAIKVLEVTSNKIPNSGNLLNNNLILKKDLINLEKDFSKENLLKYNNDYERARTELNSLLKIEKEKVSKEEYIKLTDNYISLRAIHNACYIAKSGYKGSSQVNNNNNNNNNK